MSGRIHMHSDTQVCSYSYPKNKNSNCKLQGMPQIGAPFSQFSAGVIVILFISICGDLLAPAPLIYLKEIILCVMDLYGACVLYM